MTDGVIAKFFCAQKTTTTSGTTVKFHPVSRGEENKPWAAATPAGTIEMGILNERASAYFEVGKEYYVHFAQAAEEVPAA